MKSKANLQELTFHQVSAFAMVCPNSAAPSEPVKVTNFLIVPLSYNNGGSVGGVDYKPFFGKWLWLMWENFYRVQFGISKIVSYAVIV